MAAHERPKPKVSDYASGELRDIAARLTGMGRESIVDGVIIATADCPGCGLPHKLGISATTGNHESVIAILAMAIADLLETYGFDDVEPPHVGFIWGPINGD